ncbi:MAG: flagellar hook assembly protein FlgD [Halothiobacillaceae bacterium]|nr:flagellar hook assembly protein FlgD [Halothiobacillaceae bacterium]
MSNVNSTSNTTASDNPWADIGLRAPQTESSKSRNSLGQDEFLQLMTAQLRNQDPMAPMENGEFLGQMAQFSTVQGIEQLNQSMASMASLMQSNQIMQATSMVGKQALVAGDSGMLTVQKKEDGSIESASLRGSVGVPEGATNARVSIYTEKGELVAEVPLDKASGLTDFTWDGKKTDGSYAEPGKYLFKATAQVAGKSEALETFTLARISSVSLGGSSGPLLNLEGLGQIGMGEVIEIHA